MLCEDYFKTWSSSFEWKKFEETCLQTNYSLKFSVNYKIVFAYLSILCNNLFVMTENLCLKYKIYKNKVDSHSQINTLRLNELTFSTNSDNYIYLKTIITKLRSIFYRT
jgi:hypothetical protein